MLDYLRFTLYTLLVIVGLFLYQAWEREHPKAPTVATLAVTTAEAPSNGHFVPVAAAQAVASDKKAQDAAVSTAKPNSLMATGQLVKVSTGLLNITIDTRGGDIVESQLIKYPESLTSDVPFLLLNNDEKTRYIAESGLISKDGPDTSKEQALYTAEKTEYSMSPGQDELVVRLNWQKDGIKVTKAFTFTRDSYEVKVAFTVDNQTSRSWTGNLYTQLMRTNSPPPNNGGFVNLATYFGAAISSPAKPFQKVTFKQMQEQNLNSMTQDGWVAMIQHYFISAWIPPKTATSNYYSQVTPNGLYIIGMIGQPLVAEPGTGVTSEVKLYTGPAIAEPLEKAAPGLKLTIDYGWFWFISGIIFWMMQRIYDVIGNWGWSIVFVTIIIKLIFYPLSAKSYRSMGVLKKLQPKIEALKQRHGDDKQALTKATLDLYRQEKVNPMSGCLPILIQIPVFIALYWVLVESVQLRLAPFIFWIHDLSQQDPYYVLPVLMGLSMFIQQRLNPAPPDPIQAKVMMLMPVIFTVMFANFPAGLMLYWFVNNTLSFLQQWYIMNMTEKQTNGKKGK